MKTDHFFKAAILLIAATLAGCSNDNIADETTTPQEETQSMTEFAVAEKPAETAGAPQTRTSGEYTGSAIKFYWTSGDRLWINDGSTLKASSRSNIPATGGKETTAKFWFDGTYTATTYPVRYTGNGNTAGDKVTIKAAQAQQSANDGAHIGTDGDCGTAMAMAMATRGADGKYNFTLAHKASYLTFMPYTTQSVISDAVITQIKVTADRDIAGTYDFGDTGMGASPTADASKSITLTLNGGGTNGFEIPAAADYEKNAAIMVLAPGTYSTFSVEYTIHHAASNISGTIIKEYTNLTFTAGKNKRVIVDLQVPEYGFHEYYMWDAAVGQHYWAGHKSVQPANHGQSNSNYPKTFTDPRWFHTGVFPITASRSAANCPNINEIYWYAQKGNPHWDADLLWTMNGVLSKGVMWFKKQGVIAADQSTTVSAMKNAAPNGIDYRTTSVDLNTHSYVADPAQSRPSRTPDYFFLPPLGHYNNGKLLMKDDFWKVCGLYWSSNAQPAQGVNRAYSLTFREDKVYVNYNFSGRVLGLRLWTAE